MVRIFGRRHSWVDPIKVSENDGKYFDARGNPVHLVAIQKSKRFLRPKKTNYIYAVGRALFQANDPVLDYIVPLYAPHEQAAMYVKFTNPTLAEREWLKNYNYQLVSDLVNE